jgi:hypothetical protein
MRLTLSLSSRRSRVRFSPGAYRSTPVCASLCCKSALSAICALRTVPPCAGLRRGSPLAECYIAATCFDLRARWVALEAARPCRGHGNQIPRAAPTGGYCQARRLVYAREPGALPAGLRAHGAQVGRPGAPSLLQARRLPPLRPGRRRCLCRPVSRRAGEGTVSRSAAAGRPPRQTPYRRIYANGRVV